MAKYYTYNDPSGKETIASISDKPDVEGSYPAAYMSAKVTRPQESPNFDNSPDEPSHNRSPRINKISRNLGVSVDYLRSLSNNNFDLLNAIHDATHNASSVSYVRENMPYNNPIPENASDSEKKRMQRDNDLARQRLRGESISYAKNFKILKDAVDAHRPTELFTHRPGRVEIQEAFSHPAMKHTVPIMGAYFHHRYGEIIASDDLSQHSSRMVKKAQEKGLPVSTPDENPNAEVTNNLDFSPLDKAYLQRQLYNGNSDFEVAEIPKQHIADAKRHYRDISRSQRKTSPLSNQFDGFHAQDQFPGMENY